MKDEGQETGLNFRTAKGQNDYFTAYDKTLSLWDIEYEEHYVKTIYGDTHYLCCGKEDGEPLILIHAASCGSTIWYKNVKELGAQYRIYAIDLLTESSKSLLRKKLTGNQAVADWLKETLDQIGLDQIYLCGLSIGGWVSVNFTLYYPERVKKLALLSPVQTLSKMYSVFFFKIMKMGFRPTRENIENYIGWGSQKEEPLPESIIDQFTISVMNMNSNAVFPKMLKQKRLKELTMPVLVLLGENEFAFNIDRAVSTATKYISNISLNIIKDASHLISVSRPGEVNKQIIDFLNN